MKMGRILERTRWRKLLHMACAVLLVFVSGCETPLLDDFAPLFGDKPTVSGTVENTDAISDNKNNTIIAGLPRKRERVVGKPEPIESLERIKPPELIFDQQAKERMEREAPEVVPEAKIKEIAIEFMGIAGIKTRSNLLMVSFPGHVFFDTARSKIRREGIAVIERFVSLVQITAPKAAITVVGHTDSRGTDAYNISLARRRGASAMKALASHGVDEGRIQLVVAGERQPVASNWTTEGQALNRRVEFLVGESLAAHVAFITARKVNGVFINDHQAVGLREIVPHAIEVVAFADVDMDRPGQQVMFKQPKRLVRWVFEPRQVEFIELTE